MDPGTRDQHVDATESLDGGVNEEGGLLGLM
jgi:hypothetical protein